MNEKKNDFSELRNNAKEKLKSVSKKGDKPAEEGELEQELNIQRVETEMQNDALRAVQTKLEKSLEEYSRLFNEAPVGYFLLDKQGVITNVNAAGAGQLGLNKQKLTGKHLSVFLRKSLQDDFYIIRNQIIETGKPKQFECEIKREDGSLFFAIIGTAVLHDENGDFKSLFSTIVDLSQQKEQERKTKSTLHLEHDLNEMKSRFITFASHEFRTPLASILTSTEILEKYNTSDDDSKKEKHFDRIKTAVSRINEILIDFVSAGEIEKGKAKNNPEIFNLVKFTEDLIEEIKSREGHRDIKYIHLGEYRNVFLDKELLKTVLNNLIVNAYKFSPESETIEITTEQETSEVSNITIKNAGIEIPEKDQPHVFKTFFRAGNADNTAGIGLGLNITQQLITIMGGNISFTSKENEGTIFYLRFPRD